MKQYILIGVSVLAGMLAFLIAHVQIQGEIQKEKAQLVQVQVITVSRALAAGDRLTTDVISAKAVYKADLTGREIVFTGDSSEVSTVIDRQVRVDVPAGAPLLWTYIDMPTAGAAKFASSINYKQMERAVTITVDNTTGVGGLLRPNDHVDILGTFRFPAESQGNQPDTVTLTVLQNVTILAVGQQYGVGAGGDHRSYSNVTVAVTPKEAEFLVFAQEKGKLTLDLRNPEDVLFVPDLQQVNFGYLKDNVNKYNKERADRLQTQPKPVIPR